MVRFGCRLIARLCLLTLYPDSGWSHANIILTYAVSMYHHFNVIEAAIHCILESIFNDYSDFYECIIIELENVNRLDYLTSEQ